MITELSADSLASPQNGAYHVALVGPAAEVDALPVAPGAHPHGRERVVVDRVDGRSFDEYVEALGGRILAAAIIVADDGRTPGPLRILRSRPAFSRTRVYLLSRTPGDLSWLPEGDQDIEEILDPTRLTPEGLGQIIVSGVRAYRALGTNPLVPEYYLDVTYNQIFDWFETTKWDWREVDLSQIQRDRLTDDDLQILHELTLGEFGTLPGAHNFLREWFDEYSFSSWALSWGAEEARHALVQSRYLRAVGRQVKAKYAMYKREPYPLGESRAGTLMMNVISESRAAEYYKALSRRTREPVLKKIWTLLGRDESRHARAFFVFCKELCELSDANMVATLQMAYVWLADRSRGVKHPAGFFYPHSGSIEGIRLVEKYVTAASTDLADWKVLAMIRNLLGDRSIGSVRDLKAHLRARVA